MCLLGEIDVSVPCQATVGASDSTTWIFAVLLGALAATLALFPLSSYDVWWILATGNGIIETGALPQTGAGSWTRGHAEYAYHGWAFSLITSVFYQLGGDCGLIGLRAILASVAFAFLVLAVAARGARGAGAYSLPGLALLFGFTNLFWPVRAQSASQTLLVLMLWGLARYRANNLVRMAIALPFFMIWANTHGGVWLGFAILVLGLLGEWIDVRLGRHEAARHGSLAMAMVPLAFVGCLATPYGYKGLVSAVRHIGGDPAATAPLEWAAPRLADHPLFLLLLVAVAAGLIISVLRGHFRGGDVLLFLLFALMGLNSLRYMEIAALGLAYAGTSIWVNMGFRRTLQICHSPAAHALVIAGFGVCLFLGHGRDPFLFQGGWRPNRPLPVEAARFLASHDIVQRLANPYEWGGYLIWKFHPREVAFIDGRADLYPASFIEDYMRLESGSPGWREFLDQHDVEAVLWRSGPTGFPLREVLQADRAFVRIYADSVAEVYVRRGGLYRRMEGS